MRKILTILAAIALAAFPIISSADENSSLLSAPIIGPEMAEDMDDPVTIYFESNTTLPDVLVATNSLSGFRGDAIYAKAPVPSQTLPRSTTKGRLIDSYFKVQNEGRGFGNSAIEYVPYTNYSIRGSAGARGFRNTYTNVQTSENITAEVILGTYLLNVSVDSDKLIKKRSVPGRSIRKKNVRSLDTLNASVDESILEIYPYLTDTAATSISNKAIPKKKKKKKKKKK